MNTPQILTAEICVLDRIHDHHVARAHIVEDLARQLAREMVNKAFVEPVILRAKWRDARDPFDERVLKMRGQVLHIPFKEWAGKYLKTEGDEPAVIDIPLMEQRMMVSHVHNYFK